MKKLIEERDTLAKTLAAKDEEINRTRTSMAAEGNAKIEELVKQAHEKIKEAEAIAEEYGLTIYFSVDYGMGGIYYPDKGWSSSSHQC